MNLKQFKPLTLSLAIATSSTQIAGCHLQGASTPSNSGGSGTISISVSETQVGPNEVELTVTNTGTASITSMSTSTSGLSTLTISAGTTSPSCTTVSLLNPMASGGSMAPGGTCTYTAQSANNTAPGTDTGTITITAANLSTSTQKILNGTLKGYLYAGSNTATSNAVYRFNGSSWSSLTGSPATIFDLKADTLGYIYVVSSAVDGVYEWNPTTSTWTSTTIGNGSPPPAPSALGFDSNSNLYVGTFGLYKLVYSGNNTWGNSWTELSAAPTVAPRAITFDSSNNAYIGLNDSTVHNDVQEWNGSSLSIIGASTVPLNIYNLAINSGYLYIASDGGIAKFQLVGGSSWLQVGTPPGFAKTLLFDSNNNLYAGFTNLSNDIEEFSSGSWSPVGSSIPQNIYALVFDSNGILYAGASTGAGHNDVYELASPYTGAWANVASGGPADAYGMALASTLSITN